MKGQSANEYLIFFLFTLLVFVVLLAFFTDEELRNARYRNYQMAREVALQFSEEIDIAARAGDGYMRNFTYPSRAQGVFDYDLVINTLSGSVDISYGSEREYSYSQSIVTKNISVYPTYPAYLPNGTQYRFEIDTSITKILIKNERGRVTMNQTGD